MTPPVIAFLALFGLMVIISGLVWALDHVHTRFGNLGSAVAASVIVATLGAIIVAVLS